jgi:hypothetical protein
MRRSRDEGDMSAPVLWLSVAGGGGGWWANDRYSKGGCWGGGGGGGGGIKVTPTEDANELTILLDNP